MGIETAVIVALAVAGAAAQKASADAATRQQSKTANANAEQAFRVIDNEKVDTAKEAGEQMSDRMLLAQRQLSQARVVAASGQGNLQTSATNIQAGLGSDIARANVNLDNAESSLNSKIESTRYGTQGTLDALAQQGKASRINFFGDVVTGVGKAGVSAYGNQQKLDLAKNKTADQKPTG